MDSKSDEMSCRELLQAYALIYNSSINYMKSMSLKCAIELGIPDVIHNHGQPITLSKLIETLPIHPSKARCIRRLMRLLVHSGFFAKQQEEQEEEKYTLTPVSRLLQKDQPFEATQLFLNQFVPEFSNSCLFLSTWLQNSDETPFETVNRRPVWDFLAQNLGQKQKFYDEMILDSQLIGKAVVEECKEVFEGVRSLVDVGGGIGTMSKVIARRFPHIKCTVFYLPHIVSGLQGNEKYLQIYLLKYILIFMLNGKISDRRTKIKLI